MTREEFVERLNFLRDELLEADACFDLYKVLRNQQYIDVEPMNLAPGFFQVVMHSSINCAALHLARLYEENSQGVTISKLRNQLEQNCSQIGIKRDRAKQACQEIDRLWNANSEGIGKLKYLRDKTLAHNDKESLADTLWADVGITVGIYHQLISGAHDAICICYEILDLPIPALLPSSKRDFDQIIYALKSSQE